jgi:hypothetical protein
MNGQISEEEEHEKLEFPKNLPDSMFLRVIEKSVNNIEIRPNLRDRVENFMGTLAQLEISDSGLGSRIF